MELRAELSPPIVPPERLTEIARAVEAIEAMLRRGEPADGAIAALAEATGHRLDDPGDFAYQGSMSLEEFALQLARPAWPRVADITRDELAEIVRRGRGTGPDSDYYLLLLQANVPFPHVSDLIFYSPTELDAEEIVERALAYRPMAL